MCLYNRRTHPTLEKPGAQNITACENQGKQLELSDHRKLKKKKKKKKKKHCFFKTVTGYDTKKTKRLTKLQVLTKKFTKRVFKKTRLTQLFKPIN